MVRLTYVLRFYRTEPRLFKFWPPKIGALDKMNWRTRLALIYAISAWSMVGCAAYIQWMTEKPKKTSQTDEDNVQNPSQQESQHALIEQNEKLGLSATIVYKENFVPYTTRIMQYFTSSNDSSTEK